MTGRSHRTALWGATAALAFVAGCGGQRQDAHEPSGKFTLTVPSANFPASQHLADHAQMSISVRNDGSHTVPDVAVSINSFDRVSAQPGLADPRRPVWIVDQGPPGAQTAYVETWALGALGPGKTKTFKWTLTAVRAGNYTVNYRVAAGLNGKAVAELSDGTAPAGSFNVAISPTPATAKVDPSTGRVVHSSAPATSSQTTTAAPPPSGY